MIYYFCSDGSRVSHATCMRRYTESLHEKHAGQSVFICEGCERERAANNSHIIAKARAKQLHKAELIWYIPNFFNACQHCHDIWENFKSGEWIYLKNVEHCLMILKEFDLEGYRIRVNLTEIALSEEIKNIS